MNFKKNFKTIALCGALVVNIGVLCAVCIIVNNNINTIYK